MVDSMDHNYRTHGHHRSLSSLVSSIMPIASDASTVTSVTASPLDLHDPLRLPIELKIPLPPSASQSDQEAEGEEIKKEDVDKSLAAEDGLDKQETDRETGATTQDLGSTKGLAISVSKEEPIPEPVSWKALANLAKEEQYERCRLTHSQEMAKDLRLCNGLGRRLRDTCSIAYGNMIDQFKEDDSAGFTGLYEASERLSMQCSSLDQGHVTYHLTDTSPVLPDNDAPVEDVSPLLQLAPDDQDVVVTFLNRLRTDLDYLAELISSLPPVELASLTSCYHPAGVDLSILPNHSHGRTQAYSRDSQMMKLSRRMDNVDLFHKKDPYFALLYTMFDSSATLSSKEHQLKQEVWARTCAKVMTEGKIGSEEFAIATIDSFVDTTSWIVKPEMELYIMEVLAEGWFILDPPVEGPNEKPGSAMEPERACHAIAIAEFFDRQTRKLFTMLATEARSAIPKAVLDFLHAILSHIPDRQMRELAKKFIVSRWYFASFLTSSLIYPEVRGLSISHHIGHSARKEILHQLTLQMQSQVFSVLAPSSGYTFVLPEVRDQIFRIVNYFDPPASLNGAQDVVEEPTVSHHQYIMMSPWDIIGLVETLHPASTVSQPDPSCVTSDIPSSKASSTTLRPEKPDSGGTDSQVSRNYAESSSTSGTFVEDLSQQPRSTGLQGGPSQGSQTRKPTERGNPVQGGSQSLDKVVDSLRQLAKGITRSAAGTANVEWAFFKINPDNLSLKLARSLTESALSKALAPANGLKLDRSLQQAECYHIVRDAVTELLSMESPLEPVESGVGLPNNVQHLLQAQAEQAKTQHRFLDAHQWWRRLRAFQSLENSYGHEKLYLALSNDVSEATQTERQDLREQSIKLESVIGQLDAQKKRQQSLLKDLAELRKELRVKMWYASDVKHSAPYEDALRVTKSLRAMANLKQSKQQAGLAHWAKQRLRGTTSYDRADRQALEAMCAPKDQGGLPKLADEQIELTSRWMTKNSVENFCKGEERVHRFYYEVQKLVNRLAGTSILESPVLWSSHFFRREKSSFDAHSRQSSLSAPMASPLTPPTRFQEPTISRSPTKGYMPPVSAGSRGFGDFSSGLQGLTFPQQQTHHPPIVSVPGYPYPSLSASYAHGHLSPPMTPLSPKPAEAFSPSVPNRTLPIPKAKSDFVEGLKKRLLTLVSSDLGYVLWAVGTETDVWSNKAVAHQQDVDARLGDKDAAATLSQEDEAQDPQYETNRPSHPPDAFDKSTIVEDQLKPSDTNADVNAFPYTEAYCTILKSMSLSQDPYHKLHMLSQLEDLVICSLQASSSPSFSEQGLRDTKTYRTLTKDTPRTKTTSLEEVIANCSERRASTLRRTLHRLPFSASFPVSFAPKGLPSPDAIISHFLTLFRNPALRPRTLFRDLQQIASLLPSSLLDHTAAGRAFWDTSLAAMALKEELVNDTIARASAITEHHLFTGAKHPPLLLTEAENKQSPPSWLASTTLKDAAQLWLTAAKEGSPVAARELALFYLTHPELLKRTTAPMSKGRDVFGTSIQSGSGGGGLDPRTFAVVCHWMERAASGGDKEAIEFLRENGGTSGNGAA